MSMLATKSTTHFNQVLAQVRDAGLLSKKPSFYIGRLIVLTIVAAGFWTLSGYLSVLTEQNKLWLIAAFVLVAGLGVLSAQYGFIAHEASHRQVFRNNKANDWMGLLLANLFAGLSYGFWLRKHNKHHQRPNQIGEDPDIAIRVLSFTTESKESKRGIERWFSDRQGYLFPLLLLFTGFDLLVDSFAGLVRKDRKLSIRSTRVLADDDSSANSIRGLCNLVWPNLGSGAVVCDDDGLWLFHGSGLCPKPQRHATSS
jgi:fatty acid desaturase